MTTTPALCRTCGSANTAALGPLPDVGMFAGSPLARPLPGGLLHACRGCGFVFRAPVLDEPQYLALYARGSVDVWEPGALDRQAGAAPDREDFRLVRNEIADAPLDVLDIGCFTGALLASLPAACRRHGVEPNPAAAAVAAGRGVRIVATQWNALDARSGGYDVIVACDVIEHVGDPRAFLATLARHLKPAGALIITTGNAQAWPWRLARARFWYCHYPEHISFISPRWLARMAPALGLAVVQVRPFSHGPLPGWPRRALNLAKTILRLLTTPPGRGLALQLGGDIAHDHIFCVLRRP